MNNNIIARVGTYEARCSARYYYSRIDPLAVGAKIVQIFRTNDKETMKLKLIFMIENFIFKLGCSNSEKALK